MKIIKGIISISMVLDPVPITQILFKLEMGFEGCHRVDMVSGINVGGVKCQID